jgi:hypothetical protein
MAFITYKMGFEHLKRKEELWNTLKRQSQEQIKEATC